MVRSIAVAVTLVAAHLIYAQDNSFPFGAVTKSALQMTTYDKDTSAVAVVLSEFGESFFDQGNDHNLIFEYHGLIKILKPEGLDQANITLPLYGNEKRHEELIDLQASTFNLQGDEIVETKVERHAIFTEERSEHIVYKKFTFPDVHPGSVIELMYKTESPFIFNFHRWQFQSDIPKMSSEYWATITGNYVYNISLRGFLKLSKNTGHVIKNCFDVGGGYKADCARFEYAMTDIPAFVEEDYMTAPSNFISAINFELSEIHYFDGHTDNVTKTWKDAENELATDNRFGMQLKHGKDIGKQVETLIDGESDELQKAKKIYTFIKDHYKWNQNYSKYSDLGIKKAFDEGNGNVADINLSLVAALRYAGLEANPLVLSTRENGLPVEVHPVLSDFNYVISKVRVGSTDYLLDATDRDLPFGMIPERCLNGKGRVFEDKGSYWYDLKPTGTGKEALSLNLELMPDGKLKGTVLGRYTGYSALSKRKEIAAYTNPDDRIKHLQEFFPEGIIENYQLENTDDPDLPLVEKYQITFTGVDDIDQPILLINPFFMDRIKKNPFHAGDRAFPVDFGVPVERTVVVTIHLPSGFEAVDYPRVTGLFLPEDGGKFICDATPADGKFMLTYSLAINKPVYAAHNYKALKELFNNIVQTENTDIVIRRK